MSDTEDGNKFNEFFSEASDGELRALVSTYDSKGFINWESLKDDNEDFRVKTWGEAIEDGVVGKQGRDTYDLEARSEISEHLSSPDEDESGGSEQETSTNREELPDVDYSQADWERKDIAVAVLGGIGMIGFSVGSIRSVIYAVVNVPFGILNGILPFFAVVFVIAIFTSMWSHFVREKLKDTDASSFRDRMQALRGGDDEDGGLLSTGGEVDEENQEEIMKLQTSMMKAQIKPFGWIMVVTIPSIIWVLSTASFVGTPPDPITFPLLGEKVWSSSLFGPFKVWLFWYIVCSVTLAQVVKKYVPFSGDDS